jgi:hypothetical protein
VNCQEAKKILLLYRPGDREPRDVEFEEALELTRRDPELGRWFEQHKRFQEAMQAKFRQIEPPAHLKEALLAEQKIVRLPTRSRSTPAWLIAAAAVLMLLALLRFWPKTSPPDRFEDYQAMMVSKATLQYGMEFRTNDQTQLRRMIAAKGGPGDYTLTKGLEKLPLTGGGSLRWRSNPVAMVCFQRNTTNMLFLFVMKSSAVKDPPPATPHLTRVSSMITASWTSGDKTYVLAGAEEADFDKKFF